MTEILPANAATPTAEEWAALERQCEVIAKSGLAPKSVSTPEKILTIALKGRELGVVLGLGMRILLYDGGQQEHGQGAAGGSSGRDDQHLYRRGLGLEDALPGYLVRMPGVRAQEMGSAEVRRRLVQPLQPEAPGQAQDQGHKEAERFCEATRFSEQDVEGRTAGYEARLRPGPLTTRRSVLRDGAKRRQSYGAPARRRPVHRQSTTAERDRASPQRREGRQQARKPGAMVRQSRTGASRLGSTLPRLSLLRGRRDRA